MDESLYDKVKKRFAFAKNVRLVKGYIPDSFALGCPEKIAFMHIDMNNAEAEKAALEHRWSRVMPGGMVILDDYGWVFYGKQKEAEDILFSNNHNHLVLELPTGQGMVIKHG
ncbi:MAG: TylF/MycF family methyltransferase [Desulfobulbaceae bacterium]|nr:TylF/MycF family methyltransferase [Desulfobulbaceae bacterium]